MGDAKDPEQQLSSQEEVNWRRPRMHVWSVDAYMHAFVRVCVCVYIGRVCVCVHECGHTCACMRVRRVYIYTAVHVCMHSCV